MHHRIGHLLDQILHLLEAVLAAVTTALLIGVVAFEVVKMFTAPGYFAAEGFLTSFLHTIITIVVGIEFVEMLVKRTAHSAVDVLIMATARHIVISDEGFVAHLVQIVCVVLLFAAQRFLLPKKEVGEDEILPAPRETAQEEELV